MLVVCRDARVWVAFNWWGYYTPFEWGTVGDNELHSDYQDEESRESLLRTFGLDGGVAVAAVLSALLVTYLGAAPALEAVIAALLVKRFLNPTYEEFCEVLRRRG